MAGEPMQMTSEWIRFDRVKANNTRGLVGFVGMILAAIGTGMLWGLGASLMVFGLILWADAVMDEALERITRIARSA